MFEKNIQKRVSFFLLISADLLQLNFIGSYLNIDFSFLEWF